MGNLAIQAVGLGKSYKIGATQERYRNIRDVIVQAVAEPFKRTKRLLSGDSYGASVARETFWALHDVSFDVRHGEVVGIIGRNGAGKSTLLKILSRITEPSEGYADIYGRIGALLEVGTGFHPELTGRENLYMNGTILGMSRKEIDRKFDEIVAFAEVEKFIDTPVKHYSSGMGLRLGFAVAAHLEPEILVVDEVLAVGDAEFQKKCLGKMGQVAGEGRTVLFVSHNMVAVQNLCIRAIWLDAGKVVEDGAIQNVVSNYIQKGYSLQTEHVWDTPDDAPGCKQVRFHRVAIQAADGSKDPITVSTPLAIEFEYWNLKPNAYLNLSVHVYNGQGIKAFNTLPVFETDWQGKPFPVGLFKSTFIIPGDFLNDERYRIDVWVIEDQRRVVYRFDDALVFDVAESEFWRESITWSGKWSGVMRPNLQWQTELVTPEIPMLETTKT